MMSKEYEIGIGLLEKFRDILEKIASANSEEEAKPLIESVKHPVFGAMAQIKTGEGPMREEILEPLAKVVSQMRRTSDLNLLRSSIREVLNLLDRVKKAQEEAVQSREG
jgi:hypothetical protein